MPVDQDWSWVTGEMEESMLEELVTEFGVAHFLSIPDVYAMVKEELTNEILVRLASSHDRCPGCGREVTVDDDGEEHCGCTG